MKRKPPQLDKPYPRNRPVLEEEVVLWKRAIEEQEEVSVEVLPEKKEVESTTATIAVTKKKPPRKLEVQSFDSASHAKIRRGTTPIEATLDLHGHTQATAHTTLVRFITKAQASDLRTILVITGKGRSSEGKTLREHLPRWLSESPLREAIIGYDNASSRHGGSGAWYIRIRKS